jgi:hypothetical protein
MNQLTNNASLKPTTWKRLKTKKETNRTTEKEINGYKLFNWKEQTQGK